MSEEVKAFDLGGGVHFKQSRTYADMRYNVSAFMNGTGMTAFDLVRIAKEMCCCRTCKFFVQHYVKDGTPVDFGHCVQGNTIKNRKPNTNSCGHWEGEDET